MQRSEKHKADTIDGSEHTDEEIKPDKKKGVVISILLGLYIVCSILVSSSLEECPSELAEAVSYTFLLLFGFLLIRKGPKSGSKEYIWTIMYIVWILLFLQFWINAILECTRGY